MEIAERKMSALTESLLCKRDFRIERERERERKERVTLKK